MSAQYWLLAALLSSTAMAQHRVIFDTDSGFFTDDGAALVMLLRSPEQVRVEALTLVAGNVWTKQGAEYMFHTLRLLGRPDLPLYVGARLPLLHTAAMSEVEAARWGPMEFRGAFERPLDELKPPHGGKLTGLEPRQGNGVQHLIEALDQAPNRITLLALGPLTNLAIALRLRPGIAAKLKQLVIMGGNVRVPGNSTPSSEFNFWFDPEAAQVVLRSPVANKILFPLDICSRALIRKPQFDEIIAVRTPITDLYKEDMGVVYPGFFNNPAASRPLWDELPAAWLIDPSTVTASESLYLDVETTFGPNYGKVVPLDRKLAPEATPVRVMFDLDFAKVFTLYKRLLTK